MTTTLIFAAIAAYILVIVLLAIIDWKLTKIISMMGGDNYTTNPMKNNRYKIEYR